MAKLPLLLFPTPVSASKTPGHGFGDKLEYPTAARQAERLSPAFQKLQDSFNARSAEIQGTPTGIVPEMTLVIETIGNIEDFAKAVKKIPELEWMGEVALDNISPDENFQDKKNPEKKLSGRLYLLMSNQAAFKQMLSLWAQYQADKSMTFQRGLTKFRDVFLHLKDIRRWGVEDRLVEREVFERWKEDLESEPQRNVRFEAELWYRGDIGKRKESENTVTKLIQSLGGSVISQCVIPSIAYHSVLGEIPAQAAREILKQPEVDLITCDNIMFLRPTGQMATGKEPVEGETTDCTVSADNFPAGDPVVAVLDGLPLENHKFLAGRLIVDDPDGWASKYHAIDRQHGTAMTSLIVHGDLNDGSEPLSRPVYVRPIMKPNPTDFNSPKEECIPGDVLFVDYIHRAVKRIIEGEGDNEAAALTVKVINLSIGDHARHFSQGMSPLARLLDWLSAKYKVLFIISSGNHSEPIKTGMSDGDFKALDSSQREALIVRKIYEDARHRRLLSPAESINGLTVGAIHDDNSQPDSNGYLVDVFESTLPSPVSAFGPGYKRAIKPDFLFSGGRALYSQSPIPGNISLKLSDRRAAPGNQVAVPSDQAGELNKSRFSCGTSNATALTTRAASICYDHLVSVFSEPAPDVDFEAFGVPLLKAMLVHGCSWNELGSKLDELLRTDDNGRQIKNWISQWIGYGVADFEKALGCNDQRATLLGFGQLNDGEAHVYKLPLPPSLDARHEWRKFTVTLAWLSPVVSTTQRYREAQLWFDFEDGKEARKKLEDKLSVTGIDSDYHATKRGTVQHEVFEGKRAVPISGGDTLQIKINCRKDAQKIDAPIAYGLVVSLEVAEGVDLPIYNDIRARIATEVKIPAGK
ncbi:S8 family peptidase [Candidatus Haliotispira prima]|uniref:S8 family peptidase n=1 Tax=Candidatus Haliotispira prima TaxID=3034016 RepID=A0ABY8MEI2_9SPIO|nr:S8 family peptidase [Candidatus Haliotispira prima]